MKVLWITNSETERIAEHFSRPNIYGAWLSYSHELIGETPDVELYVMSFGYSYEWVYLNGIHYYGFIHENYETDLREVLRTVNPDIIHIWGTEYEHFYMTVLILRELNLLDRFIVSIQGFTSVCYKYYRFALPKKIAQKRTIYEFLRHTSPMDEEIKMEMRGEQEIKGLKITRNCIGRTDFDRAIIRQYNPDAAYYKCNEILRRSFYDRKWNPDNCDKHSIVFSQSGYILKGFHLLIEAFETVLRFYPDAKIYAVGKDPFIYDDVKDWIKRYSYREYLKELIIKKKLTDKIKFVGSLNEQQMVEHYLRGNVFVSASGIENSSNSVGEAMILGLPIVASDVGGIKTFIRHNEEGILYQSDLPEMLADGILRIFDDEDTAQRLGNAAHRKAMEIYDPQKNTEDMIKIYYSLIK